MTSTATPFIGGVWVPASDAGTREIRCPAVQSLVGTVSEATPADVHAAIGAARTAFDAGGWAGVPAPERGDFLLRVAAELRARRAAFARAETLDTGKRLVESEIDLDHIANCFSYFGKLAGQDAGRRVDANVVSRIVHEPVGVCGLIAPWNRPLLQAAWEIAPALAAGNTFVLTPSELTPHTSILTMELLDDLGLPAEVANLVLGAGAVAGALEPPRHRPRVVHRRPRNRQGHPYLPQAEWGGYGQSGVGRELGPMGLTEHQGTNHIYQNTAPAVTGWFPAR